MTQYKWTMFMAHIKHEDIDYIEEKLNEYKIRQYIIGMETADSVGEHLHFLVEMEDGQYHNFSNAIFKKKYKLRGQNRNGLCKQYGKIKEIKDLEKAKSYTVKSKNVRTNMSDADIQQMIDQSFEKENKKKFIEELYEHLNTKITQYHFMGETRIDSYETYDSIKLEIIKYYMDKDLNLAPQYKSLIINYVRKSNFPISIKLNFLKHIIN